MPIFLSPTQTLEFLTFGTFLPDCLAPDTFITQKERQKLNKYSSRGRQVEGG